ncbi:MAG: hypothetical protein AAF846_00345 [Chloroflexota bacterium]
MLIDTLDNQPIQSFKTGDEIAHYIEQHPPIELVDSHIDDPVEWVATQRRKRIEQLNTLTEDN